MQLQTQTIECLASMQPLQEPMRLDKCISIFWTAVFSFYTYTIVHVGNLHALSAMPRLCLATVQYINIYTHSCTQKTVSLKMKEKKHSKTQAIKNYNNNKYYPLHFCSFPTTASSFATESTPAASDTPPRSSSGARVSAACPSYCLK